MRRFIIIWIFIVALYGCDDQNRLTVTEDIFEPGVVTGRVETDDLKETSGIVGSIANPSYLWAHNDGGDKPRIFLIDSAGQIKATIWFDNVKHRDWEDIAIGPGPDEGKNYVFVGDIGDNESEHKFKFIYRIEEPALDLTGQIDTTLTKIDCIKIQLPDGSRDAEAMLVDPLTKDIYIFSKREVKVNLYKVAFPQSTTEVNKAELVLPKLEFNQYEAQSFAKDGEETLINGYHSTFYNQVVGSDISPDGLEIIVKSYSSVYYWKRGKNESIPDALKKTPMMLPYIPEPQGEAIAFDRAGKGYYTLSEERGKLPQRMFFYRRK